MNPVYYRQETDCIFIKVVGIIIINLDYPNISFSDDKFLFSVHDTVTNQPENSALWTPKTFLL